MMTAALAHLWQSTLFATLAALLTLAFRHNRAAIRYCIWLAASVKFLIPLSPLVAAAHNFTWQAAPIELSAKSTMLADFLATSGTLPVAGTVPDTAGTPGPGGVTLGALLLAVWACGAAAAFTWWLVRWLRTRAVLRASSPLRLDEPIPVHSSPFLLEPGLLGVFHPVIVLPENLIPALSPRHLDAVLEHELSHWRRRDNLTAALHMIVEALFWFYPFIWWIGNRLVVEREQACDEAVIHSSCDRQGYAEAILRICENYPRQSLPCVAGVAGGDLKRRIATIMTARVADRLRIGKKLLLAGVACCVVAAPLVAGLFGSSGVAAAELNDGLRAFDHGDYRSALAALRPLAEQGNAAAQERVGQMYDRGLGVTRDYAQAAAWYRKAAMQGNPAGQQDLSGMYSLGHGVPRDPLAGALWARQSVLGILETPCDPKLMFETIPGEKTALQTEADHDDPQAAAYLGSLYEIGTPGQSVDHVKALKWLSKSAQQGNPKGEAALASLYLSGFASPPTGTAAVTWMRKAAEQGLERAQCSLAVMYDQGIGVARDRSQAAGFYRGLFVSTDHRGLVQDWARTKLAALYETGDGLPRDDDEAVSLLRSAAEHGYPFAEARLGIRYATANALQRDYAAAARLLESAAKKGLPAAQIAIGNLYADGHGVPQSPAVAYKWFDLAARYSTSAMEREEAKKDRERISGRMTQQDIALAERLVARWLPANAVGEGIQAGGDM